MLLLVFVIITDNLSVQNIPGAVTGNAQADRLPSRPQVLSMSRVPVR
mgnify:CR=1 FL=1